MTTVSDSGEKSFTVHVPHSPQGDGGGGPAATRESYLRLGSPDGEIEQAILASLRASYTDVESQAAVEAAFGASPTAGVALFTEGDLVQFVNGKSDTRVLNDSYVVHVLNREESDGAAPGDRTYRAYLRLGRPSADIETPLVGAIDPEEDPSARFSLGTGVALYSDAAVTITTPEALKVTVGKDTRTVLGETYAETYDVDQATLDAILDGTLSEVSQISDKRLITASLTRREATGVSWRTTKFDLSKTLNVAAADNGSFTLGSEYAFSGGLKLSNSLGATFEAMTGVSLSASLGLKVELGGGGIETTTPTGKVAWEETFVGKGTKSVVLSVDPTTKSLLAPMKAFSATVRAGMAVVNGALAAYTASFAAIGASTTSESDGASANVKEMMEAGEAVYLAAVSLNALIAAATLAAGVVQLTAQKTGAFATAASTTQPSNIVINDAGIKLQVGSSYIHVGQSGIIVSGTQILAASPSTSFVPTTAPGNATPAGIAEIVTNAGSAAVDIFHLTP